MQIEADVKRIVSQQLGVELNHIQEQSSFVDDLGADSLAIVELVLALEEHFKIDIPESQTEKIRTVGDAIAYIEARRKLS